MSIKERDQPGPQINSDEPDCGSVRPSVTCRAGLLFHAARGGDAGMFVATEVWNTREEYQSFFDSHVAANLPPGVTTDLCALRNFLAV